jgi:hypothetical protein
VRGDPGANLWSSAERLLSQSDLLKLPMLSLDIPH